MIRLSACLSAVVLLVGLLTAAPAYAQEYAGVYIGCSDEFLNQSASGLYLYSYRGVGTGLVVNHKVNYWFNLKDVAGDSHNYVHEHTNVLPSGTGYIRTATFYAPHLTDPKVLLQPFYKEVQFVVYEQYPVDVLVKSAWEECTGPITRGA